MADYHSSSASASFHSNFPHEQQEAEPNEEVLAILRAVSDRGASKRLRDRNSGISKRDWTQWVQTIFNNLTATLDRLAAADGLHIHDVIRETMTRSSAALQLAWFFPVRGGSGPYSPMGCDPGPARCPEGRGLIVYSPPRTDFSSPDAISAMEYNPPSSMESKLMRAGAKPKPGKPSTSIANLTTFMLAAVVALDAQESAVRNTASYSSEELLNPNLPGGLPGTPCRVIGYALLKPDEFVSLANLPTDADHQQQQQLSKAP